MKSFNWRVAILVVALATLAILTVKGHDTLRLLEFQDATSAFPSRIFLITMGAGILALLFVTALFFREIDKIENLAGMLAIKDADHPPHAAPAVETAVAGNPAPTSPPCQMERIMDQLDRLRALEHAAAEANLTLQKHQQDLQANSRYLATISHDIRTPMNAVLGMSELLLADTLNTTQRSYVLDIQAAARSLLTTVGTMPSFGAVWRYDVGAGEAQEKEKASSPPGVRVLVVDDNMVNLRVAQGMLRIEGIQCDTATSGLDALRKLEAQDYSLVFMDYMMPDMDGVETTRRIRMMPRTKKTVPVVALTANVGPDACELYRKAGMNDFLPKPLDRESLRRVLSRWLPSRGHDASRHASPGRLPLPPGTLPSSVDFLERVRTIDGLDVDAGLRMSCGQPELFGKILRTAAKTLPEIVTVLRQSVAEKDFARTGIEVHGLKSSLASIGASSLSNRAGVLESHYRGHNSETPQDGSMSAFLDDLQDFSDKLRLILVETL